MLKTIHKANKPQHHETLSHQLDTVDTSTEWHISQHTDFYSASVVHLWQRTTNSS